MYEWGEGERGRGGVDETKARTSVSEALTWSALAMALAPSGRIWLSSRFNCGELKGKV